MRLASKPQAEADEETDEDVYPSEDGDASASTQRLRRSSSDGRKAMPRKRAAGSKSPDSE